MSVSDQQVRHRVPAETASSSKLSTKTDADLKPDYILVFSGKPKIVAINVQKSSAVLADAGFYVAVRHGAGDSVLVLVRLISPVSENRTEKAYEALPWTRLIGVSDSFPVRSGKPSHFSPRAAINQSEFNQLESAYGLKTALVMLFNSHLLLLISVSFFGIVDWFIGASFRGGYCLLTIVIGIQIVSLWNGVVLPEFEARNNAQQTSPLSSSASDLKQQNASTSATSTSATSSEQSSGQRKDSNLASRQNKRSLFIPLAALSLALYAVGQVAVLALEVFCTQMYNGPSLGIIKLVPVGANIASSIVFHFINGVIVDKYTKWENYPTDLEAREAKFQRAFYLDASLAYLPIGLTAYLYLPFGNILVGVFPSIQLSTLGKYVPLVSYFKLNTQRLLDQTKFFTLQQPLINIVVGALVPKAIVFVKRNVLKQINPQNNNRFSNEQSLSQFSADEEFKTLSFALGYVLMSAPVWPLGPTIVVTALIIRCNIVRYNLANRTRQPLPGSPTSLESWAKDLKFILLLSSVVGPTITLMYGSHNPARVTSAAVGISYYYDYYTSAMRVPWAHIFAVALVSENLTIGAYNVAVSYYKPFPFSFSSNIESKSVPEKEKPIAASAAGTQREADAGDYEQQESWQNIDIVKDLNAVFQTKLQ